MSMKLELVAGSIHSSVRVLRAVCAIGFFSFAVYGSALAQTPPAPDAACTVTAFNRTAPLEADESFTIYNIPGTGTFTGAQSGSTALPAPPFRVRAVCSDGTVGESDLVYPDANSNVAYTGNIYWRPTSPIPVGLTVSAATNQLFGSQTTQLTTRGVLAGGQTLDLSTRALGTFYASSNSSILAINDAGLATTAHVAIVGAGSRVIVLAQNEGVASTTQLQIGPMGSLRGKVTRADGVTVVSGAQVSIILNQPRETVAIVTADASGNYVVPSVTAGTFSVSVTDPLTGDRGLGTGSIQNNGDIGVIDVRLIGQGIVTVNVTNGANASLANAPVTFTSLSGYRDIRTLQTNASGQVVFDPALAGRFSVSTRDQSTGFVAAASGILLIGQNTNVSLRLQAAGSIVGTVYGTDGSSVQEGTQVRVISATRGLVTQSVTKADGQFGFDALPLADGPYVLDAAQNGRIRARIPNLVLAANGQELVQNIVFGSTGRVTGTVTRNGNIVSSAKVTLQSLVGERYVFSASTNAQGVYTIEGVPVGAFGLTATGSNGEVASASGSVTADGQVVTVDLQLASNGIVGTVFNRDAQTPVGAGIQVVLANSLGSSLTTTQTDAQGRFGLTVTVPGSYTINASDNQGNRGQTQLTLTSIDPSNPTLANVTFLGQGTVIGVVMDTTGALQSGAIVRFTSNGLFPDARSTVADEQGRYSFSNVFVGAFSILAQNLTTNIAGVVSGRVSGESQIVVTDVILAATGSISGRVLNQNNSTPVPNAEIVLTTRGTKNRITQSDDNGYYSFAAVPLGDFTLYATNPVNRDQGQTTARLVAVNEPRTINIRMLGHGAVRIKTVDSNGGLLSGVTVRLDSHSAFLGGGVAISGTDGTALITPIFNGEFAVQATMTSQDTYWTGYAEGVITGGATVELTVAMTGVSSNQLPPPIPPFNVNGIVTDVATAVPQVGVTVNLNGFGNAITDSSGRYEFLSVPYIPNVGGRAIVRVLQVSIDGRARARVQMIQPSQGETVTRDLGLIGVGTVSGQITNAQNQPQGGIAIELSNPDPYYGGTWRQASKPDGTYSLAGVPVGNFVIKASAVDGTRRLAQSNGGVKVNGELVTIDLMLVDNAVSMPQSLYDANAFQFDVQGNGTINSGTNGVFLGNGSSYRRASRLDLIVAGVSAPFQNGDGSLGRMLQDGRAVEVDELNQASGLNVTRRIFTPKNGYFVRYLDILENRTPNPITVGVRITSAFSNGNGGARVVDTSSSDDVLDITNNSNRDRWIVVDDSVDQDPFLQSNNPAVAVVFDGVDANVNVAEAAVGIASGAAESRVQWNNVTVPVGGMVAFMHFDVQQIARSSARAAAERLLQLPPEALEGLSTEERLVVQNFKMPESGLSDLTALPSVEKTEVRGVVYASDAVTPIPGARVIIKGDHLLYGRTYVVEAGIDGRYAFASANLGLVTSRALAQYPFTVSAVHPQTIATTSALVQFDNGQIVVNHDLILTGTGILKGSARRHTGALLTSGTVILTGGVEPAGLGAAGEYEFTGLVPGTYTVSVTQNHLQGQPLVGSIVAVVAADSTSFADVAMEATGEVRGVVLAASGAPAVGASVVLGDRYRSTVTDTGGVYRFADVREGSYSIAVRGAFGSTASGSATITRDVTTNVDLRLSAISDLTVRVNYQRMAQASGVQVDVSGADFRQTKITSTDGLVVFSTRAGLELSVRAEHPDNRSLFAQAVVTMPSDGQATSVTLTLPAAADITGTVYRPDGSTPVKRTRVWLKRQDGTPFEITAFTDDLGAYRFYGLPLAAYSVIVEDRINSLLATRPAALTNDGQQLIVDLTLAEQASRFGVMSFAGERQLFTLPVNAGDVIFVSINGAQLNVAQSGYLTRVQVYDPTKVQRARGHGYDSRNGFNQYNELGDLRNIVAIATGNYTFAISPYYSEPSYLGGFRLAVTVNGQPVEVQPYLDGGSVVGAVNRVDGVTPARDKTIEVSTSDALSLRVRTTTGNDGTYQLAGVPIATARVAVVESNREVVNGSAVLTELGQTQVINLQLPTETVLAVQIQVLGAVSIPASVNFTVTDVTGTHVMGPVTFPANVSQSGVKAVKAYGDTITVRAVHPSNALIASTARIVGADQQTVPVQLTLATASLSGYVTNAAGNPVNGAFVIVEHANDNSRVGLVFSDSTGFYQFDVVPGAEDLILVVPDFDIEADTVLAVRLAPGETAVRDIRMAAHASLSGRVVRTNGQAIGNASVEVSFEKRLLGASTLQVLNLTTDVFGRYEVPVLPVGRVITVKASLFNGLSTTESTGTVLLANADEAGVLDLTLDIQGGTLAASIVRSDGEMINGAEGPASCSFRLRKDGYDSGNGPNIEVLRWANCNALQIFDGLPPGGWTFAGAGQYEVDGSGSVSDLSAHVTVIDNDTVASTLIVSVIKGVVRYRDGSVVNCPSAQLHTDSGTYMYPYCLGGRFEFLGFPVGPFTLTASDEDRYVSVDGELSDIRVPVVLDVIMDNFGTVTGRVTYLDGSAVPYPQVRVQLSSGDWMYAYFTDEQGNYQIAEVPVGTFTLHAQDPNSGLTRSVDGELVSPDNPVVIDVVLPESGRVTGTFRTYANEPIAEADVYVSSDGSEFTVSGTTDSNGAFTIPYVALGNISVAAVRYSDSLVAEAKAQVAVNEATVNINLVALPTARLSGQVTNADGSAAPMAVVGVVSVKTFGPVGPLRVDVDVDAIGNFEFASLPVGRLYLSATLDSEVASTTVNLGQDTVSNLQFGGSGFVWSPFTLTGSDSSIYDFDCDGSLMNGGFGASDAAYDWSYYIHVGVDWFPCGHVAQVSASRRGLTYGPYEIDQLSVSRKTYVPTSGGYARYVETYVNPTLSDVTVRVRPEGWIWSNNGSVRVDVAPVTTGGRYAITSSDANRPVLGHVFGGAGASLSVTPTFATDGGFSYEWLVTVPAGGRVSLMHFAVQRAPGNVAAATSQAEALSTGADPNMFDELTAEERAGMRNFVVP